MSKVDKPDHYAGGREYEPLEVIEDWGLGFSLGNVVKYISRYGRKEGSDNPVDDLEKARCYLSRYIDRVRRVDTMSGDTIPFWRHGNDADEPEIGDHTTRDKCNSGWKIRFLHPGDHTSVAVGIISDTGVVNIINGCKDKFTLRPDYEVEIISKGGEDDTKE